LKARQKTSARPKKQNSKHTGARTAVLLRWQRLVADNSFDDRVTALCAEYDLNDYLPVGRPAKWVIIGNPDDFPEGEKPRNQDLVASGQGIMEGVRAEGEDYPARLRKVISLFKRDFNLSADFDWLLQRYILWGDAPEHPVGGPTVETSWDEYGVPHLKIEITPLTSIADIHELWPIVQKKISVLFPHQDKRSRTTLDENRLAFIVEQRERKDLPSTPTFAQIAAAWQKKTRQPTTADAVRKAYNRARKSGR
jgi:hypothetical protein